MLREWDIWLTVTANQFAGQYKPFDFFVVEILNRTTFNFLPVAAIWFAIFFVKPIEKHRILVLEGLLGAFIAVASSKILQTLGAQHPRPVFDPAIQFIPPSGLGRAPYIPEFSSFPSDHATLAFAMAACIWRFSPRLGALSGFWAVMVVCTVRFYGGWHYVSDLIGGAVWGISWVAIIAYAQRFTAKPIGWLTDFSVKHEPIFMAGLFFLSFQLITFFDDIRLLIGSIQGFLGPRLAMAFM